MPAALEDLYEALRSCDPRLLTSEAQAAAGVAPIEQYDTSVMEELVRRAMLRYLGEGRWTSYEGFVTSQAAALRLTEDEILYMHLVFYLSLFNQHATQHVADTLREHRGRSRGAHNRRTGPRQGLSVDTEKEQECSDSKDDLQDRLRLLQILQDRYRSQVELRIEEIRSLILRPRQETQTPANPPQDSTKNASQNSANKPQKDTANPHSQDTTSPPTTPPQDASSVDPLGAAGDEQGSQETLQEANDSTINDTQCAAGPNLRHTS